MHVTLFQEEALYYFYLEKTLSYGRGFSKRPLGIIQNNHWIGEYFYFMYHSLTKHVVVRKIALLSNTSNTEVFNICARCYSHSNIFNEGGKYDIFYINHLLYHGPPDLFFNFVFKDPFFDIYDSEICFKKFGSHIHESKIRRRTAPNMYPAMRYG